MTIAREHIADSVASSPDDTVPLCVDLDGTLIKTDLLHEAIIAFLKAHPLQAWRLLVWLLAGRVVLKHNLSARVAIDPAVLPYRRSLVAYLEAARSAGRDVHLVSASPKAWVEAVATHLGLFGRVDGSDESNLKGARKAAFLVEAYGEGGFDYVGDSSADRPVWAAARHALVAGRATRHGDTVAGRPIIARFAADRSAWRGAVRAMRPHQWSKNLLIFLPVLAAHRVGDLGLLAASAIAFLSYSMIASATYLINDLSDLDSDRAHPRKSRRPFAAGDLSVLAGVTLVMALFAMGIVAALFLPPAFLIVLALYTATTLLYSFRLKRAALVDVFALGGFYTLRLIAGTVATGIALSMWLLAFSMFLFLALAVIKRVGEISGVHAVSESGRVPGRGYYHEDLEVLVGFASASSFCAVLVLAIYTGQPHTLLLYRSPVLLWLICPLLLFWLGRMLLLARRGHLEDDPIVFAARDRISLALIATSVVVGALAATVTIPPGIVALP